MVRISKSNLIFVSHLKKKKSLECVVNVQNHVLKANVQIKKIN